VADVVAAIVSGLAQQGYAAVPDALPRSAIAALRDRAALLASEGALVPAQVRSARREVRGDRIAWLDEAPSTPAETALLAWLAALRDACNRELLLGLFDFEDHYALSARRRLRPSPGPLSRRRRAGSFMRAVSERRVAPRRGRRAAPVRERRRYTRRLPEGGTLVASSRRVRARGVPATRARIALAGWFRRRALRSP
jgi:SM-20-related protein